MSDNTKTKVETRVHTCVLKGALPAQWLVVSDLFRIQAGKAISLKQTFRKQRRHNELFTDYPCKSQRVKLTQGNPAFLMASPPQSGLANENRRVKNRNRRKNPG